MEGFNELLRNLSPKIRSQDQIDETKKKLKKEPNSIELLSQLAENYNFTNQHQKAIEYCDKILTLEENNKLAYNNIFYAYDRMEDFDRALEFLNIYLKKYPLIKDPNLERYLYSKVTEGYFKKNVGNLPLNIVFMPFNKSSQVIDNNFSSAFVFSKIGWSERVFEVLNLILEFYPHDIFTLNGLAYKYMKKKKYIEAKEAIDKALLINNEDFNTLLLLGGLYRITGKYEKSKSIYNQIIQNSNLVDIPLNSSFDIKVYAIKGNISDLQNFFGAYNELGLLCNETGEFEQAVELFTKVLNFYKNKSGILFLRNPNVTPVYHSLGLAYFALDNNKLALKAFKKGIKHDSMNIEILASLGELYFVMKKYSHAIETFQHIINIKPESHFTWHKLSKSYFASGKREYAFEANNKCLNLNPKYKPALKLQEELTKN